MSAPGTPHDAAPASTQPARRSPRRFFSGLLLVCVLLFGWYCVRGTWATTNPTDPTTPEQGVTSHLVLTPEGDKEIRTAIVIPVSVDIAWKILSDYEEWERLFKTVRRKQVAEKLDEHRHHVVSDVMTPLGTVSLDFIVYDEPTPEDGHRAWWDAPTADLPVNSGTIRITPKGPNRTLFVYTVRKQWRKYPRFLVNNMLLDQQKDLVRTLSRRMIEIAQE